MTTTHNGFANARIRMPEKDRSVPSPNPARSVLARILRKLARVPAKPPQSEVPEVPDEGDPTRGIGFYPAVFQYQDQLILRALHQTQGNKTQAAKLLHLKRTTLLEIMRRRGLELRSPNARRTRVPRETKRDELPSRAHPETQETRERPESESERASRLAGLFVGVQS